jgi:protein-tyrosine phosphatase
VSTASNGRSAVGRVYRVLRHFPDRLLQKKRYRAASQRLSAMSRPRSILVVCHGNICRSPYLEAVLKRALPDVRVTSAGFVGPGRPVPPFSLRVSAQRGFDLSGFRSRPLAPTTVRDVDLVIVMDSKQARYVSASFKIAPSRLVIAGDLDPRPSPTRTIEDPWHQPIEVFVSAFDRLDRCAATVVNRLRRDAQ